MTGKSVLLANEPANPVEGGNFSSQMLAFSPDGRFLAGGAGNTFAFGT